MKVSDLRKGMRGVNVKGEITDVSETKEVVTRYGTTAKVATATLKDDSGSVKLTLWNEDIEKVSPGALIEINNGYTSVFRGILQLNIGRFGKLKVLNEE
ncbi:MAG: OB-fold nucleic acid binding domain-containing protein [Candidatus Bathyarchaeia archaeon]